MISRSKFTYGIVVSPMSEPGRRTSRQDRGSRSSPAPARSQARPAERERLCIRERECERECERERESVRESVCERECERERERERECVR